ncbi:hypothetical protein [Nocardia wallacei]|uniref:hypothetical protein n=1 Tax=Nocardia wallacei TaxID=480035 RepID=UPI0024540FDE|nr:hypothetical protein [Nocardia wallacei]
MQHNHSTLDAAIAELDSTVPEVLGSPFWTLARTVQFEVTVYLPLSFVDIVGRRAGSCAVFRVQGGTALAAVNAALDELDRATSAAKLAAA